ncbi:MAG: LysE family transporter [Flavobacteriales bacterium]|nr:LysE family transporter [Flavobacteriales bacterium]
MSPIAEKRLLCAKVDTLLFFLAATVASFIGSLQAGVVNTAVLAHTIKWGRHAGRRMAVGGSIPEFIYAGVAFFGAGWLVEQLGIGATGITIIVSTILLVLGIYFVFIFYPRPAAPGEDKLTGDLRRGVLLGMANPQLLLFWCGVKLMLVSFNMTSDALVHLLAFALGAFTGAIILLMILVRLGVKAQEKLSPTGLRTLFRSIGCLLLAAGGYGMMRAMGWVP